MGWKFGKVNAIVLAGLLCLVGFGVAQTLYFDNKADALQPINEPIVLTGGNCRVLGVEETLISLGHMML